jgi:hypothetical protein
LPTPDPKAFKTANEYACKAIETKADDIAASIEAKKAGNGDKKTYPGEAEYNAAFNKALKDGKDLAAAQKAGRDAVKDVLAEGKSVDPATGESDRDRARREWESTQTDRTAKGGKKVPPPVKTPLPATATQYMKDCDAAGVPLPPKWGDERWVKQGNLPQEKVLASSAPTTEVWTYKTPDGICYALPRIDGTPPTIQLLGQICQSNKTGKACFWDNLSAADGKTRTPVTNNSGPENMAGADKMDIPEGEQCTSCHRGDNVFIIHPGTALQQGPSNPCSSDGPFDMPLDDRPTDSPKKPYEPIAPKFGNKNEPLVPPLKNAACTNCHSIPKLTVGYCQTILSRVIDGQPGSAGPPPRPAILPEMPPPDGKRDAQDQASADELKDRCKAIGARMR